MRAVVGLGNPGTRYLHTRHNVGFMIVDRFAAANQISFQPSKYDYFFALLNLNNSNCVLVKPATYMNLSGLAVKQVIENFQLNIDDLLVIVDDINLPLGTYRVRLKGGDGGHNGLSSIIYQLNSDDFARIRIGVGNNFDKGNQADFVLSNFSEKDFSELNNVYLNINKLLLAFITNGTNEMLNVNSKLNSISTNNLNGV